MCREGTQLIPEHPFGASREVQVGAACGHPCAWWDLPPVCYQDALLILVWAGLFDFFLLL